MMKPLIQNWEREELLATYGPDYLAGKSNEELAILWREHSAKTVPPGELLKAINTALPRKSKKVADAN